MHLPGGDWAIKLGGLVCRGHFVFSSPTNNDDPNATFSILPITETQTTTVTVTAPAALPPKLEPPSGFVTIVTASPTAVATREKQVRGELAGEDPASEDPASEEPATYGEPTTLSEEELLTALETIVALSALEEPTTLATRDDHSNDGEGKKKFFKPYPQGVDEPDPENKKGHKHPTFDNSGEPFCFRWPGGEIEDENYEPKCPNGDKPTLLWRCTVLNLPYFEKKKNYRAFRWFKCPGLVKDW
ncbi:hypothetical protein PISL3812_06031 [Talaromyces islandicus]|uniref:Uncharacterized protein n=1 Tax=Talaromyces islandicus TaxID=28573 RepID=A0A0U1M1K9_TALIS|nr:hypothetical protein PISL3812_06031 [Talaromyces islandicus]